MRHTGRTLMIAFSLCLLAGTASAQLALNPPGPPGDPPVPPMRIIARYFDLSTEQMEKVGDFREAQREAIQPLREQIADKRQALLKLMESPNPDPAAAGNLVIEIHKLREQIAEAQKKFNADFEGILNEEQLNKLEAARKANRLEPVLRAMRELRIGLPQDLSQSPL